MRTHRQNHAHCLVRTHGSKRVRKVQPKLLPVPPRHQARLVAPIPFPLKNKPTWQGLLTCPQVAILPHSKRLARRELLIDSCLPHVSILARKSLCHCTRRQCVTVRARGSHSRCKLPYVYVDFLTFMGPLAAALHSPLSCRLLLTPGLGCLTAPNRIGYLTPRSLPCLCPGSPRLAFGTVRQAMPSYAAQPAWCHVH
jgi:hypothetical protein